MRLRTMALIATLTAGAIVAAAWIKLDPVQDGLRLLAKDAQAWTKQQVDAHR